MKQTIKEKDSQVLVPGCGNSLLAEKMFKGLALTRPVTGIDFEENVIKKMKNRNAQGTDFVVMDVTKMTYKAEVFDFVVDKGTLDAICSDSSSDTTLKVIDYLNNVVRVLKTKGTFIIVSLLQNFVLDAIVSFFSKSVGNTAAHDNIFELKIQKIDKVS